MGLKFVVCDIKVATKHPDADKLFVEQIDVGEENLRSVCSGLADHVSDPSSLNGLRGLLFTNLPTRKMKGIKSEGMLMMAETNIDGKVTVSPLNCSAFSVGDFVTFENAQENDFEWFNNKKVKTVAASWELVSKELKTDADGFVVLHGHKLLINGSPLKSDLKNAVVK